MSQIHRIFAIVLGLGLPIIPGAAAASTHTEPIAHLRPGDRGETVKDLQKQLHWRGYYWGPVNGVYDQQTRYAVWSLQKRHGLRAQGEVGPRIWRALDHPQRPRPLVRTGRPDRVEIDLSRQLLTVYRTGRPVLISHISTGAEAHYCENGHCGDAITPTGDFRVASRAPGWTTGVLGSMYNSLYFLGGIAMHGSTEVPLVPASHGCVRVPLATSERLFRMVAVGEPVHVRGSFK